MLEISRLRYSVGLGENCAGLLPGHGFGCRFAGLVRKFAASGAVFAKTNAFAWGAMPIISYLCAIYNVHTINKNQQCQRQ